MSTTPESNQDVPVKAPTEPKPQPSRTPKKPAFKYNDLIEAFRKLDRTKVAAIVADDDLSDPDIAREFVEIFRESGCLLMKYPAPAKEKARDELAQSCVALVAKCSEATIPDDLNQHISDAQVFEKGFREILKSLHESEIWKRSPSEQAWGIIYRSLGEFEALKTHTKSELGKLAAKENAIFDPNQFRLPTKDTHGTQPDAVIDEIIQGLGITLLMLGNLHHWLDGGGTLILPNPTPRSEAIEYEAGTFTLLAMQWRHLEHAWERSRLFKAKATLIEKAATDTEGQSRQVTVLQVEAPGIAEAKDRVALDRLIQVFGQRQMSLGLSPVQSELIGGKGATAVPLVPAGYFNLEEYVSADVLTEMFHVPVEDPAQEFAGLSLKEWLRGYAYYGRIAGSNSDERLIECLRFTEKELIESLKQAGLSEERAQRFISSTSIGKTTADPFDTPLIRTQNGDLYFFTPAFHSPVLGIILLSRLASLNRRRDSRGQMANDCQFTDKGAKFERFVLKEFARVGIPAHGFRYSLDNVEYDCDAAVIIDDALFVFECKNYTLPMMQGSSLYYFLAGLPGVKEQAKRIANQLEANPDIVRKHFGAKALWKRVVPVVLFALPWATGLEDGVYVYDASALSRLIRDGEVAINVVTNVNGTQVRKRHARPLRSHAVPTAQELENDMKRPSQVMLHIAGLKLLSRPCPVSEKMVFEIPEWAHRSLSTEEQLVCLGESPKKAAAIAKHLEGNSATVVGELHQESNQPPTRARQQKVGRNASCPCGSGLKYKRCCLDKRYRETKQNGNPSKTAINGGFSDAQSQQST